jgi:sugar lactone lactonase YvrE
METAMNFDVVLNDRRFALGEGPHYDRETGNLYWVDIVSGQAWRMNTSTGSTQHWTCGTPVTAFVPRAKGGFLLALKDRLEFFDPATGERSRWSAPEGDKPGNRSNEARVDPTGRFWLGTMQNNIGPNGEDLPLTQKSGSLYRIDANGAYEKVAGPVGVANTLCWDEFRNRLYFADSMAGAIYVYDWDKSTGHLANPRLFARPNEHGVPDGSALDAEGCLWNARWGGGCLIRYRPDGSIDRIVPVPVANPTSCVFAGTDLRTLYVTSAYQGLTPEQRARNPLEGALLMTRTDVQGQPCTRLAA